VNGFELILDQRNGREIFNIGTREEITISHLDGVIAASLGKEINFSTSVAPLGETNRRVPDISRLEKLGFRQSVSIENGVKKYCDWYVSTLP
jgi:nucleoside-diphosphate-sugar epimerase